MRRLLAAAFAVTFAMVSGSAAALEVPGPLVTTEWLFKNQASVRILDVRADLKSYKEGGHIVGAVQVDFKNLRAKSIEDGLSVDNMSICGDAFQAVMRAAGVSTNQPVVITHRSKNIDDVGHAAYLYWQLKLHGHDNVAILDGGTTKWIAESREVWGEDEDVEPGDFVAGPIRNEMLSETNAVKAALAGKRSDLFDARPFDFFVGLEKRPAVLKAGHIPGAMLFPFTASTKADGTFRDKEHLAAALTAVGLSPARPAVVYCNTGHTAAILWFVLHELVGHRATSLYDGSMLAWTSHGNDVQTAVSR